MLNVDKSCVNDFVINLMLPITIMRFKMKNKKWTTPRLEILSRVSPEEFVLTACKQQQSGSARDPGTQVQMCGAPSGQGSCAACQARGQS